MTTETHPRATPAQASEGSVPDVEGWQPELDELASEFVGEGVPELDPSPHSGGGGIEGGLGRPDRSEVRPDWLSGRAIHV